MAKGIHSKIKKRLRASKRKLLEQTLEPEREKLSRSLRLTARNLPYRTPQSINAFRHPENPEAEFPQYKPPKIIDFRSSHNPFSGLEFTGHGPQLAKRDGLVSARMAGGPSEELQKIAKHRLPQADEDQLIEQLLELEIKRPSAYPHMEIERAPKRKPKPKAKGLRRMLRF